MISSLLEENKKLEMKLQHKEALVAGILDEYNLYYNFAQQVCTTLGFPANDNADSLLRNNLPNLLTDLKEKMKRCTPSQQHTTLQSGSTPAIISLPCQQHLNMGNCHQIIMYAYFRLSSLICVLLMYV